jgi:hypothetical protein
MFLLNSIVYSHAHCIFCHLVGHRGRGLCQGEGTPETAQCQHVYRRHLVQSAPTEFIPDPGKFHHPKALFWISYLVATDPLRHPQGFLLIWLASEHYCVSYAQIKIDFSTGFGISQQLRHALCVLHYDVITKYSAYFLCLVTARLQ